jgi:hypothetical protein
VQDLLGGPDFRLAERGAVGAGQPMIVRSAMNDGLSVTALAASKASYRSCTFSW